VTPAILLHTSNRLEELAEALAVQLQREPPPPLADETILVPGPGLERWLRQQLASRFGIAAGLVMPFPGQFLQQLLRQDEPIARRHAPEVLRWRLFRLLGDAALRPQLGPAADYTSGDDSGLRRFQLGSQLAACLDDYQLYRDGWLERASNGDPLRDLGAHGPWQAALWQALLAEDPVAVEPRGGQLQTPHPALRLPWLRAQLQQLRSTAALPRRLSVFGITSLPPAMLQLLAQLAALLPVHLYVLQPTAEFRSGQRHDQDEHGLLQRFGRRSAELAAGLQTLAERSDPPLHHFDLPALAGRQPAAEAPTLLQCLQDDLARARERGAAGSGLARHRLQATDESLLVHDCHSPLRELEVVRDRILQQFAAKADLEPHEVLVLVPDIGRYAPYARAVFGPLGAQLPFQIADKAPASDLPICRAVLELLRQTPARLQVDEVLLLLDLPAVQQRFGLAAGEVATLRSLLLAAGVQFGLDAGARAASGELPAFAEHSWAAGLERLLLGVATGPLVDLVAGSRHGAHDADGVWPLGGLLGAHHDLLQRALPLLQRLFDWLRAWQQPQPAEAWAADLLALVDTCFAADREEDQKAVAVLQRAAAELRRCTALAELAEPLSRELLLAWLTAQLQQPSRRGGFGVGAVTVAAMLPMRTVPVRCLFVCGLDDAAFPRQDRMPDFHLMAQDSRPGDPSLRSEDRQLFLDLILAARDQLHCSYVGRSQRDDSERAPSVALGELLDWIDRNCEVEPGTSPREPGTSPRELGTLPRELGSRPRDLVLRRHALQAWSPRYAEGDDPRWFTYRPGGLIAVGNAPPRPFWTDAAPVLEASPAQTVSPVPGPAAGGAPTNLAIRDLLDWLQNPSRHFLQQVLGLRLLREEADRPPHEPFEMHALDRYQLLDTLLRQQLRGPQPSASIAALLRHSACMPVGSRGASEAQELAAAMQQWLQPLQAMQPLRAAEVHCHVAGTRLSGSFDLLGSSHLVVLRSGKLRDIDRVLLQVQHALLTVARHQGQGWLPERSLLRALDASVELPPLLLAAAEAGLARLLAAHQHGQQQPLPFFAKASCQYAASVHKKGHAGALAAAAQQFAVQEFANGGKGDADDAWIALCWRDQDALQRPDFAYWALQLAGPALAPETAEEPA